MADEPSIDEILASLDRLLKEGEGRNDEPEEALPPADESAPPSHHDAPTPHFFEVLDEEAEAPHAETPEPSSDAPGDEAVQGGEPSAEEPAAPESRLFVLTDAMMVDDQPSLPLGMGGEAAGHAEAEADDAEAAMRQALELPESLEPEFGEAVDEPAHEHEFAAPEPAPVDEVPSPMGLEPETETEPDFVPTFDEAVADTDAGAPEPIWDEAQLQALVDQVTDDVCSAIAEQLPEMIRMALAQRLGAFVDTHTPHQDTGSQE